MSFSAKVARKRLERAPIGIWESYLGGGNDMLIGITLTFHSDGTGTLEAHGFDWQYDAKYVGEPSFRWSSIGAYRVEITHRGEASLVAYDFRDSKNEYGMPELRIFEPGKVPDEYGDVGFWISPFSLVYRAS